MGGATALALLPFLPHSRPISMILVDPGLELSADLTETIRGLCIGGINDARAGKGFELSKAAYPQWKEEDVMWTVLGMYMCDIAAIEEIFRQNRPWSFAHLLGTPHPNISITILIADPSSTGMRIADDIKVYPDIKSVLLPPGTGHWVQYERPEAIVEEALKAVALQRV
ncbi:hypothetical protein BV22DRAFT_1027530 [Leucogyrophana mollusca]|uniref:Uncharacterized protein n=1 Tax=Leucogyrophana mollusca TaxID=85980 RepID=A0ACB8C1Q0_9AGAM|nr:hypothetical protein BV22DRAFT_1027530 [Leucogyrophana mollusca]